MRRFYYLFLLNMSITLSYGQTLTAPTNVRATRNIVGYIEVTWDWVSQGCTCTNPIFEIKRGENPQPQPKRVVPKPNPSSMRVIKKDYTNQLFRNSTNIQNNKFYYYSIRVFCCNNWSDWSEISDYGELLVMAGSPPNRSNEIAYGSHPTPTSHKAFVIGNGNYDYLDPVTDAVSDARSMSQFLRQSNWGVTGSEHLLMKASFEREINRFLTTVAPTDTIVFYYSGHGLHYEGQNYLLPKRTQLNTPADIARQGYNLDSLLNKLGRAHTTVIVILEVTRPNNQNFDDIRLTNSEQSLVVLHRKAQVTSGLSPTSSFTEQLLEQLKVSPCRDLGAIIKDLQPSFQDLEYDNKLERPFSIRGCD